MSAIFSLFHLLLEQDFLSPSPCAFFDARLFINLLKPEVSIPKPDDPLLTVASKFVALLSFHLPPPRSSSSSALPLSNTSSTAASASSSTLSSTEDNAADFLEDEDEILWKGFSPQQMETLPIDAHAEKINEAIRTNHVVILTAETGSGKSSRVPQMILRDHDPERDDRAHPFDPHHPTPPDRSDVACHQSCAGARRSVSGQNGRVCDRSIQSGRHAPLSHHVRDDRLVGEQI